MRLRDTIKRPHTCESESIYLPKSQRGLRSSNLSPEFPHFIDYDPDLPPAVFPTLNEPRPAYNLQVQMRTQCTSEAMVTQKSDIVTRRQGVHVRFKDVEVLGSVQDIPLGDSENFLVSNGPQNLTY